MDLRGKMKLLNVTVRSMLAIERFVENYNDETDRGKVAFRLERADELYHQYFATSVEVEALSDESDTKTKIDLSAERDELEEKYYAIRDFLSPLLPKPMIPVAPTINTPVRMPAATSVVRLPKINLPSFDGDINGWIPFRDAYKSLIHDNQDLQSVDKFHYLMAALKNPVRKLLETTSITADNYQVAWDLLVGRYDNKRLLIKTHMSALFAIESVKKESSEALLQLVDQFERHVKILTTLGESTTQWSSLLVHMVCSRLDKNTLREWEKETSDTTSEIPTYTDLIEFIHDQARILLSLNSGSALSTTTPVANPKEKSRVSVAHAATVPHSSRCPVCTQSHRIYDCDSFKRMSHEQKLEAVRKGKLCFNCLSAGHLSRDCSSKATCRRCNKEHHTLLHSSPDGRSTSSSKTSSAAQSPAASTGSPSSTPPPHSPPKSAPSLAQDSPSSQSPPIPGASTTSLSASRTSDVAYSTVLLSTALVKVHGLNGKSTFARALLDSCSESNFITERIVQLLGLKRIKHVTSICGMGASTAKSTHCTVATFSSADSTYTQTLTFCILPKITNDIPARPIDTSGWRIPTTLALADPDFASPQKIDLVIGAQLYLSLLREGQLSVAEGAPDCQPLLQSTVLGWVVSGPASYDSSRPASTSVSLLAIGDSLDQQLAKFWEVEACSKAPCLSKEEILCEKMFAETTTRDESGRFVVRLPMKEALLSQLGDSESIARRQLHWMQRRLAKNTDLNAQYHSFMQEYIELGHMVPANSAQGTPTHSPSFFLPHHAVIKPSSTTTKCRVVFNGSSKSSTGVSLNDCMMVGPTVQDSLFAIALRFRFHDIALVADITKMYRQIWVHPDDRKFQQILWEHPTDPDICPYELATVTYGTASAPYLATRCLKQLSFDHSEDPNDAAAKIGKDFYVDDLLSGAGTINEAIKLRSELQSILESAGFELRKWASNSEAVLSRIPDHLKEVRSLLELDSTLDATITTLGQLWHPESDNLRFKIPEFSMDRPITKRVAASEMARLFDPSGLVGPVVIKAKIFVQRLWKAGVSWDEPLPHDLCAEWQSYRDDLAALTVINIPRLVKAPGQPEIIEIHGFCDASQLAYGACIYIRSVGATGVTTVRLLTAKSRVAPIQTMSIVRLELCSAQLLSHLFCKVGEALDVPFTNAYFWSDSMVNIHRLRDSPSNYGTFEANRLADCQQLTDGYTWRHVAGLDNPADLISRGANPSELDNNTLWWKGPPWLALTPEDWPITVGSPSPVPVDVPSVAAVTCSEEPPDHSLFNRYSSLTRLLRVAAYCRRFIRHCRLHRAGTPADSEPFLTSTEVSEARLGLVRVVQEECFPTQLELARTGRVQQLKTSWRALDPFYDEGALRVGGRLGHSAYSFARKHPLILPAKHPFTNLLVESIHKALLHAGPRLMIAHIREQYWPLNVRNLARKTFRTCITCYRVRPEVASQLMGQLPKVRITPGRAFLHTGVDYCGPVLIKQPKRGRAVPPARAYIALFICMATKAVHFELVSDLSTEGFLAALDRFVSRRGRPITLHCDNATNFVGANKELRTMLRQFRNQQFNERVAAYCTDATIELRFIPARAPTFGGLWEAAVRALKHHLRRVVGTESLPFEAMLTVLAKIESCLNSRPLSAMSEDPSDLSVLTPGHFLVGSALQSIPEPDLAGFPCNRLSLYQQIQQKTQQFWKLWSLDYLNQLQQRTKNVIRQPNVAVGQLVLLKEDNVPPLKWCMGRITSVRPGADGLVRVVQVKLPSGAVYDRPIVKVCVLPLNDASEDAVAAPGGADGAPE